MACAARAAARGEQARPRLRDKFSDAPIVSLHLWLDRPILDEPFVGLLDSPVHWVFSRDHIHGPNPAGQEGHVITAVVSGARDLVDKTGPELEELTLRELAPLPARGARRARAASHGLQGAQRDLRRHARRPSRCAPMRTTEWSNFWLAGDWTEHRPARDDRGRRDQRSPRRPRGG